MLNQNKCFRFLSMIFISVFCLNIGLAQTDELERNKPTAFLYVDYGMSFYKSKLIASNDSSYNYGYSLGIHGGAENNVAAVIRNDINSTSFSLNDSKIQTSWQDVVLRYYWGVFYVGGIISSSVQIKAQQNSSDLIDAVGSGYGANLGMLLPLKQIGIIFINANYVMIGSMREKNQISVKIPSRIDADLGSVINVSKNFFDFIIGYKQQISSLNVSSSSYQETINTTYVGMRFCMFF